MRGEEAQPGRGGAAGDGPGPRHAAARRSLLTRIQLPAGKAIALAAMPTAVLMGMGFTPRLAQADELAGNTVLGGGHCVSRNDTATVHRSPVARHPAASSTTTARSSATAIPLARPLDGGPSGSAQPGPDAAAGTTVQPTADPSPTADGRTPGESGGGLDSPVTGSDDAGAAETDSYRLGAVATPVPGTTATSSRSGGAGGVPGAADLRIGRRTPGTPDSAPRTASPAARTGPSPQPCPTNSARPPAAAGLGQTPQVLPDRPWTLKTDLLTLTGLVYYGIVKVRTHDGTVKDVLKFTATGVDIENLHQIIDGPDGARFHVRAAPGSTSTIRNGTVTMYTEELKGDLLGVVPIDFTPLSPPALSLSTVYFTHATVIQAGQFGGTLTVPGMHLYRS